MAAGWCCSNAGVALQQCGCGNSNRKIMVVEGGRAKGASWSFGKKFGNQNNIRKNLFNKIMFRHNGQSEYTVLWERITRNPKKIEIEKARWNEFWRSDVTDNRSIQYCGKELREIPKSRNRKGGTKRILELSIEYENFLRKSQFLKIKRLSLSDFRVGTWENTWKCEKTD